MKMGGDGWFGDKSGGGPNQLFKVMPLFLIFFFTQTTSRVFTETTRRATVVGHTIPGQRTISQVYVYNLNILFRGWAGLVQLQHNYL